MNVIRINVCYMIRIEVLSTAESSFTELLYWSKLHSVKDTKL